MSSSSCRRVGVKSASAKCTAHVATAREQRTIGARGTTAPSAAAQGGGAFGTPTTAGADVARPIRTARLSAVRLEDESIRPRRQCRALCPASRVATDHSDDEVARSRRRQPTSEHDVRTACPAAARRRQVRTTAKWQRTARCPCTRDDGPQRSGTGWWRIRRAHHNWADGREAHTDGATQAVSAWLEGESIWPRRQCRALCPASRVATDHSDDEVARSRRRQPTSEHDVRTAVSSSSSSASSAHHSEVATHCTLPTARETTAPSAAAQSGGALDAPTTTGAATSCSRRQTARGPGLETKCDRRMPCALCPIASTLSQSVWC